MKSLTGIKICIQWNLSTHATTHCWVTSFYFAVIFYLVRMRTVIHSVMCTLLSVYHNIFFFAPFLTSSLSIRIYFHHIFISKWIFINLLNEFMLNIFKLSPKIHFATFNIQNHDRLSIAIHFKWVEHKAAVVHSKFIHGDNI